MEDEVPQCGLKDEWLPTGLVSILNLNSLTLCVFLSPLLEPCDRSPKVVGAVNVGALQIIRIRILLYC